jgi:hypothetical protein
MEITNHAQPGSEYDAIRDSQHQTTPDQSHDRQLTIYPLSTGMDKRTIPAINEAIAPFLIDLKEFSLIVPLEH